MWAIFPKGQNTQAQHGGARAWQRYLESSDSAGILAIKPLASAYAMYLLTLREQFRQ